MSVRYDCSDPERRAAGLAAAVAAVRRGELVVLPTDTVYGLGADAFTPAAVDRLLGAKGRGREMPPPVLTGSVRAATALVEDVSSTLQILIEEFWPGALTLVCRVSRTLSLDLGDSRGTIAIRMPLHPVALDLLRQTGPLAVSSANITGVPAATTADQAEAQLGGAVAVILDGGPCAADVPSTIVDLTGLLPRLLREGAIPLDRLTAVTPVAALIDAPPAAPPPAAPGDQDVPGEQGVPGEKGVCGEQGVPGDQGVRGEQGVRGDQGVPGDQGMPGEQGVPGEQAGEG